MCPHIAPRPAQFVSGRSFALNWQTDWLVCVLGEVGCIMREEEYRHRIHWLWARAEEFQTMSESMHYYKFRAATIRMAEMYEKAARELEDVLERKLHDVGINESQRDIVAAKLATLAQGARTDLSPFCERSQANAAELLNVGKRKGPR